MRRILGILGALVVAAALVAVGWFAGRAALDPPRDPLATPQPVSYEVADGTVGRSLPLSATASWPVVSTVQAPVSGVVTSVDIDVAKPVAEGARIASINLVPVVVARGTIPAFRDLTAGAAGADVKQLEDFLARSGYDPGTVDGTYSTATATAVRAWQKASGQPVTGTVALGSVVFVDALPARIRVVTDVGKSVGAGGPLAEVLGSTPEFTVGITQEQTALIPPRAEVDITGPSGTWQAVGGEIASSPEGGLELSLLATGDEPICGDECAAVSITATSQWPAAVVIVPRATGPLVPVAAVQTGPDGSRYVITEDGTQVPVTVLASSDGQAVVDGITAGTKVLLPPGDVS